MSESTELIVKAAEMLDGMQSAAQKRVLAAYRFDDNLIRGSVIEMQDATMADRHVVCVRFSLNGEEIEKVVEVSGAGSMATYDKGKAFKKLVDEVSKAAIDEVIHRALAGFSGDAIKSFGRGTRT